MANLATSTHAPGDDSDVDDREDDNMTKYDLCPSWVEEAVKANYDEESNRLQLSVCYHNKRFINEAEDVDEDRVISFIFAIYA